MELDYSSVQRIADSIRQFAVESGALNVDDIMKKITDQLTRRKEAGEDLGRIDVSSDSALSELYRGLTFPKKAGDSD